jgi:hypothetical protein
LLCARRGVKTPFTLDRHNQDGDQVSSILEVIKCFTDQLAGEEKNFRKVWDSHVGAEEQGGMYHYSGRMAQLIESDL